MLTQIPFTCPEDINGKTIKGVVGIPISNRLGGCGVALIFTDNTFVVLTPTLGNKAILITGWSEKLPYSISDNGNIITPELDN